MNFWAASRGPDGFLPGALRTFLAAAALGGGSRFSRRAGSASPSGPPLNAAFVTIRRESVVRPTHDPLAPDRNPMFPEKRV